VGWGGITSWLDWLWNGAQGRVGQVTKYSVAGWSGFGVAGASLLENTYNTHSIVRSLVKEIASSVSMAPLEIGVMEGHDPDTFEALDNPATQNILSMFYGHPVYDYTEFMERIVNALYLTGVSYLESVPPGGPALELWPLVTSHVDPKKRKGPGYPVDHYMITIANGQKRRAEIAFFGESRLSQMLLEFIGEMVDNRDLTGGTMAFDHKYDADQVKRYLEMIREDEEANGRGRTKAVAGKYTAPEPLEKYDFSRLENRLESRGAAVTGTPPIVASLGVGLERSTYSNYKTARKAFQQETLSAVFTKMEACFTRAVFGLNSPLVFKFKNKELAALNADQETLGERPGDGGDAGVKGGRPDDQSR
jgi:hypothetical protein